MPEQRGNALLSEENKLREELPGTQENLDQQLALKNAEIEKLLVEQRAMQSKLPLLSARAQEAEAKASQLGPMLLAIDAKDGELAALSVKNMELQALIDGQTAEIAGMAAERDRLTADVADRDRSLRSEQEQMLSQIEVLKSEVEQKMAEIERLSCECASLGDTISALTVRTSDAEARRLEAYEFARICSDAAYGLRRELEVLKRDLAEALDFPRESLSPIVEHRHRDVVESMSRLFPGTEATRYIARDPHVERVSRMALELREARAAGENSERTGLQERVSTLQEELNAQKARAEQAEAFASEWHEQIMTIRSSASWRWAKRLRKFGRMFKFR